MPLVLVTCATATHRLHLRSCHRCHHRSPEGSPESMKPPYALRPSFLHSATEKAEHLHATRRPPLHTTKAATPPVFHLAIGATEKAASHWASLHEQATKAISFLLPPPSKPQPVQQITGETTGGALVDCATPIKLLAMEVFPTSMEPAAIATGHLFSLLPPNLPCLSPYATDRARHPHHPCLHQSATKPRIVGHLLQALLTHQSLPLYRIFMELCLRPLKTPSHGPKIHYSHH